jgi:hypothetical protein
LAVLADRQRRFGFSLTTIDVDSDPGLTAQFGDRVPVVVIDGIERFRGRVIGALFDRLFTDRQSQGGGA